MFYMLGKNPPKFAIANNFAIGTLPSEFLKLLTEVSSPLLSIVRPYAYICLIEEGLIKQFQAPSLSSVNRLKIAWVP
jgi:hypothetical protein